MYIYIYIRKTKIYLKINPSSANSIKRPIRQTALTRWWNIPSTPCTFVERRTRVYFFPLVGDDAHMQAKQ